MTNTANTNNLSPDEEVMSSLGQTCCWAQPQDSKFTTNSFQSGVYWSRSEASVLLQLADYWQKQFCLSPLSRISSMDRCPWTSFTWPDLCPPSPATVHQLKACICAAAAVTQVGFRLWNCNWKSLFGLSGVEHEYNRAREVVERRNEPSEEVLKKRLSGFMLCVCVCPSQAEAWWGRPAGTLHWLSWPTWNVRQNKHLQCLIVLSSNNTHNPTNVK